MASESQIAPASKSTIAPLSKTSSRVTSNSSSQRSRLRELTAELQELEAKLRLGGGSDKIDKQHKQGKLTARERIELLLDKDSYQQEIGLLVAYDQYKLGEKGKGEGGREKQEAGGRRRASLKSQVSSLKRASLKSQVPSLKFPTKSAVRRRPELSPLSVASRAGKSWLSLTMRPSKPDRGGRRRSRRFCARRRSRCARMCQLSISS